MTMHYKTKILIFLLVSASIHLAIILYKRPSNKQKQNIINIKILENSIAINKQKKINHKQTIIHKKAITKDKIKQKQSLALKSDIKKGTNNPYIKAILNKINSKIQNSPITKRHIKGTVLVKFQIDKSGNCIKKEIISSSNTLLKNLTLNSIDNKYLAPKTLTTINTRFIFE